jgi:hypothetical protein
VVAWQASVERIVEIWADRAAFPADVSATLRLALRAPSASAAADDAATLLAADPLAANKASADEVRPGDLVLMSCVCPPSMGREMAQCNHSDGS